MEVKNADQGFTEKRVRPRNADGAGSNGCFIVVLKSWPKK